MIYYLVFLISIIISLKITHTNGHFITVKKMKIHLNYSALSRDFLICISALGPFLLSALRYGIGTDYFYTYIPQFNTIARGGSSYYETGFYLLNKFVAFFTQDGQWLIATTSLLFIWIVYNQIFKNASNYAVSIFLLFLSYNYFISLNNIRQSLASAILLIAIDELTRKNNKILFIFFVIIAGTIHQVSFLFLLFIFLEKIEFSAIVYSVISITVFVIGKYFIPPALNVLASYIPRLNLYLTWDELNVYKGNTIGMLYVFANVILMLILIYIEKSGFDFNSKEKSALNLEWQFIKANQCLLLCVCGIDAFIPAAYRIVRMFSFSHFLFFPNVILKTQKRKQNRIILMAILVLCYLVLFIQNYMGNIEEVYPYCSIFDGF